MASRKRKPRKLIEKPHFFIGNKQGLGDSARPRPDGYMGRKGWVIRDGRPRGVASYWVADCPVVGCDGKVTLGAIVCGACNFTGERRISVDWMMWWYAKMTIKRYRRLMEAHFEDDAWEFVEPAVEGWR